MTGDDETYINWNVRKVSYITWEDVFNGRESAATFYFKEHPFPSDGEMILVEYPYFLAHLDRCEAKADKETASEIRKVKDRLAAEFGLKDVELFVSVDGWRD